MKAFPSIYDDAGNELYGMIRFNVEEIEIVEESEQNWYICVVVKKQVKLHKLCVQTDKKVIQWCTSYRNIKICTNIFWGVLHEKNKINKFNSNIRINKLYMPAIIRNKK